jgi:hypothetical protein
MRLKMRPMRTTIGVLPQTLTSLERLRQTEILSRMDWLARLSELERRIPGTLRSLHRMILRNALFAHDVRVELILRNSELRDAIATDPTCDIAFGLALAGLTRTGEERGQENLDPRLIVMLDTGVSRNPDFNMLLRLAFSVSPERYRDKVVAWIAKYATAFQTHFLMKSWLDWSEHELRSERSSYEQLITPIERHVMDWLDAYGRATHGSFVITSWLDAAAVTDKRKCIDMVTKIEPFVTDWLGYEGNAMHQDARFVYRSWLRATASIGGEQCDALVAEIEDRIKSWLAPSERTVAMDSRFLYSSWLGAAAAIGSTRAAAMISKIEPNLLSWLDQNATSDAAPFIYESWLDAAAASGTEAAQRIAQLENYIAAWLNHEDNSNSLRARFVYYSWLLAAEIVRGPQADRMTALVEDKIATWLTKEGRVTSTEARFIFEAWLRGASDTKIRRFFVETLEWVEAHKESRDCGFVLDNWLSRHLEFDLVKEACFAAVRNTFEEESGAFILKFVTRQKKLPKDIVLAALSWCANFPKHPDALYRIGPLIRIENADMIGASRLVGVTAKVLLQFKPDDLASDAQLRGVARATIGSLFTVGKIYGEAEKLGRVYFVRWLKDGRIFRISEADAAVADDLIKFDQKFVLAEELLTVLAQEEFSPEKNRADEAKLIDFCEWVATWLKPEGNMKALVEELTDRFGCEHIWRRMIPGERLH